MEAWRIPRGQKECFSIRTPEQIRWEWVKSWLDKANEDLFAAEVILASKARAVDTAAFHAQQAAEKALKALLIRHQLRFGKTHDIEELLELAQPAAPGISSELAEAARLTLYAVDVRYPGEEPVRREVAGHALAVARRVVESVIARLRPYLDAGRPGS